jgi:quercetin dioxygenase-like cupin family protein
MFYKASTEGYTHMMPGIERKTLAYGEKTLCSEFRLEKGKLLPKHAHPYEQTGYLVKGRLRMTIGPETFDASPGSSWCVPADVEHCAEVVEDSVAIEVFSPVRPDYLPGEK